MSPDKENANHASPPALHAQSGKPAKRTPDSSSQSDARALQAGKRRRAAADWIESLTGVAVSATSDRHFRESLKDGTLLCQVLNIIRPGCITQVLSSQIEDAFVVSTCQCRFAWLSCLPFDSFTLSIRRGSGLLMGDQGHCLSGNNLRCTHK